MNFRSSDTAFQLLPHTPNGEMPQKASPKLVNMYFIGYKVLRPVFEMKEVEAKDGRKFRLPTTNQVGWTSPPVIVGGRVFQLPEIGDFLSVPAQVYEQIKEKLRWPENNIIYEAVTDDPNIARSVKQAWIESNKNPANMNPQQMASNSAQVSLGQISDEVLMRELERRANLRMGEVPAEDKEVEAE